MILYTCLFYFLVCKQWNINTFKVDCLHKSPDSKVMQWRHHIPQFSFYCLVAYTFISLHDEFANTYHREFAQIYHARKYIVLYSNTKCIDYCIIRLY